jgi:hypothetical protein
MTFVGAAASIVYEYLDERRRAARRTFYQRLPLTAADGEVNANLLRSRIDALTGCYCVLQELRYDQRNIAATSPVAGSSALEVGTFVFTTSDPVKLAVLEIPGFLASKLVQPPDPFAGVNINQADSAVAAFVAELTSGAYTDQFGVTLVALDSAYLQVKPVP